MAIFKWDKKLRTKFGWDHCKDVYVARGKECLKKKCFHPHDWYYDKHLVCLTNYKFGCPQEKEAP